MTLMSILTKNSIALILRIISILKSLRKDTSLKQTGLFARELSNIM
jgi:hypothetical protein